LQACKKEKKGSINKNPWYRPLGQHQTHKQQSTKSGSGRLGGGSGSVTRTTVATMTDGTMALIAATLMTTAAAVATVVATAAEKGSGGGGTGSGIDVSSDA